MNPNEVYAALDAIRKDESFLAASGALVDSWDAAGAGIEFVDPVLRLMEAHPDVECGMPGELVHFVERFHRRGYEPVLMASIARRPTCMTTWMLRRLINGTQDEPARSDYLRALAGVPEHPLADEGVVHDARFFLEDL